MSSRKYGDPKRRKSTEEKGHDRRQNSCRRSSRAQTRAKVSKKRERRAGEKNIPIIRVIAQSFAPSFESLAKWLRNSPACEQPCNFSLTCEILLFLTHASFHMRKIAQTISCFGPNHHPPVTISDRGFLHPVLARPENLITFCAGKVFEISRKKVSKKRKGQ